MSAFVVSNRHIDLIVTDAEAFIKFIGKTADPTTLGEYLLLVNEEGIRVNYGGSVLGGSSTYIHHPIRTKNPLNRSGFPGGFVPWK